MIKILKDKYGSEIYEDGSTKNLTEMARIGFTDDNYEIYVNTNDSGNVPHFHYRKENNWSEFHTCIRIDKAEYFHHGNKQDILNSKQRKELVKFLKEKPEDEPFENNWRKLIYMWNNENNSDKKISKETEMPDYMKLK